MAVQNGISSTERVSNVSGIEIDCILGCKLDSAPRRFCYSDLSNIICLN